MKPRYLAFNGINSFSERAEIDFTELLEFGIFGIFGDTGSGKSTILDCIAFALYGNVRRGERLSDIINYNSEEAYVHFEFEIFYKDRRRVYRVERSVKRKENSHAVTVYEKTDGKAVVVATGVVPAREFLLGVIGLEQKDFEKCIALPQGEFAQFVKAPRGERLKLVSRLFDLDRYGERLVSRVNDMWKGLREEERLLDTALLPYAEISEEGNRALRAEIEALAKREEDLRTDLAATRETEKRLAAQLEKKQESDRVKAKLAALEEERPAYEALKGDLRNLEKAAAVVAAAEEGKKLRSVYDRAAEELSGAKAFAEAAERRFLESQHTDAEAIDAEIEALVEEKSRAAAAEELLRRRKRAAGRMEEIVRQIRDLDAAPQGASFDERQREIEERRAALGSGNFLEFLEKDGKDALLRREYAVFAGELETLTEKYPEIAGDSVPLAAKYRALSEGERATFRELRAEFEARERAREEIGRQLLDLEKLRGRDALRRQKLAQLSEEYLTHKRELEELGDPPQNERSEAAVERLLSERREQKRKLAEQKREAAAGHTKAQSALAAAEGNAANAAANLEAGRARFLECLRAGGFDTAESAAALVRKYGDAEEARAKCDAFFREISVLASRLDALKDVDHAVTEEELLAVKARAEALSEEQNACAGRLAVARERLVRSENMLAEKRDLEARRRETVKKAGVYEKLKKLIDNNQFMEFVAEEHLQTVAVNASGRLVSLTGGRYFLRYDRGFFVGDNFHGGSLRGVNTLSGGETFLVSLSLALALGAEICARSLRPIEFFFLDEGFGTLDEQLVDTVMDSLEKLRSERFCIGIISHVGELKHRIERKLTVKKATEEHGSVIEK